MRSREFVNSLIREFDATTADLPLRIHAFTNSRVLVLFCCVLFAVAPAIAASDDGSQPASRSAAYGTVHKSSGDSVEERQVDRNSDNDDLLRTIGALAAVVVMIVAARLLLKRCSPSRSGGAGKGVIEILARAPLAARQQLVLVRMGRRLVLISAGPQGAARLAEIADPAEADELLETLSETPGQCARPLKELSRKIQSRLKEDEQ